MHITNLVPNTRNNNPPAKLADGYTLVFFIREGLTQFGFNRRTCTLFARNKSPRDEERLMGKKGDWVHQGSFAFQDR